MANQIAEILKQLYFKKDVVNQTDIDRYCVLIEIQGRLILILRKFDKIGS